MNAKKEGYGAIILGLYHTLVDDRGRHVDDEQVARWTSKHSPVPVFGFWDFSVGKGLAMGGLTLDSEPQGREAANSFAASSTVNPREPFNQSWRNRDTSFSASTN